MGNKETIKKIFEDSLAVKKDFVENDDNLASIEKTAALIVECYKGGGKVLVFGNGGSAADSQHFAAELVVRFEKERRSLPCVALTANTSILTATSNDYDFTRIFSRQVEGLASSGDIALAISTSGNSENVLEGVKAAHAKGLKVIALTGRDGGKLGKEADISIVVNVQNTARIQETHVTVLHAICKIIEDSIK